MKNKVKTAVISAAVITAIGLSAALAYFSDNDEAENSLTVGINTIEIEEDYSKPDSTPDEGDTIAKNPSVKCTEGVDCYVRMYCEFSDAQAEKIFSLNFDTENWTEKQSDGYYYYIYVLSEGESTTPLFTEISVEGDASGFEDLDLICYAESVQAVDADTGEYFDDYEAAWEYWNSEKEGLD